MLIGDIKCKGNRHSNYTVKVIGMDPEGSILGGGTEVRPYKVEGIGYDFFPGVLNNGLIDQYIKSNVRITATPP